MDEPKLKSRLWISALLHRCSMMGTFAAVVRKGDADAGAIIVKINTLDGNCRVYKQARDGQGQLGWMDVLGPQAVPDGDAETYIARQAGYDEDLWVVEVEDRSGHHPMIAPLI